MKKVLAMLVALAVIVASVPDVEARRYGGGFKSSSFKSSSYKSKSYKVKSYKAKKAQKRKAVERKRAQTKPVVNNKTTQVVKQKVIVNQNNYGGGYNNQPQGMGMMGTFLTTAVGSMAGNALYNHITEEDESVQELPVEAMETTPTVQPLPQGRVTSQPSVFNGGQANDN